MSKFGRKIAVSIIVGGLFIVVSFLAIDYQSLTNVSYSVIITVLVFIFLFGFAIGQNFASPLNEVIKNAYNVTKGEIKKINLKKETKDEVEDLVKVFNTITQDLQGLKDQSESVKKNSDIKFKTKELLSNQIIVALEEKIKNRTTELERSMIDIENLKRQITLKDEQIFNLNKMVEAKRKRK